MIRAIIRYMPGPVQDLFERLAAWRRRRSNTRSINKLLAKMRCVNKDGGLTRDLAYQKMADEVRRLAQATYRHAP